MSMQGMRTEYYRQNDITGALTTDKAIYLWVSVGNSVDSYCAIR
jgi:hypothetical protein